MTLLLVVVLGEVVDEDPRDLTILPEEFTLAQGGLLPILPRKANDVQQIWNDHAKLLKLEKLGLLGNCEGMKLRARLKLILALVILNLIILINRVLLIVL